MTRSPSTPPSHNHGEPPFRRRWLSVLAAVFLVMSTACLGLDRDGLEEQRIFQRLDTPETCFRVWQTALHDDDPDAFYYALSRDVRLRYPLWHIRSQWGEIRDKLAKDLVGADIIKVEYLLASPKPPRPAARVVTLYNHPDAGLIVENFLLVLELDTDDFREQFPQWRVHFPHSAYNSNTIWFPEPNDPNAFD